METTFTLGYGEASSPSVRVGAAWRELGTRTRALHRRELIGDIAALRPPREPQRGTPARWDWNPVRQQRMRLLAATY